MIIHTQRDLDASLVPASTCGADEADSLHRDQDTRTIIEAEESYWSRLRASLEPLTSLQTRLNPSPSPGCPSTMKTLYIVCASSLLIKC